MATAISVEASAEELGFDPARLRRIDQHFEQRYVATGKLPGFLVTVARGGQVVHVGAAGHRDVERGAPVTADTLWRIYSMTKPITSVVLMTLYEEGAFQLTDEVARYLPEFADTRVYVGGTAQAPRTEPQVEPMRIWHLLSHTAGLTYGFTRLHPVDEAYRLAGFDWGSPRELDLEAVVKAWAALPLRCQPGSAWNYSVATDVCGRLIEVLSGQPLDRAFAERVLQPLGMHDTAFSCDEDNLDRLAELYLPFEAKLVPGGAMSKAATRRPAYFSGGGGLVSSARDYHRFTTMLLQGGELHGVRILGPRTIEMMTSNHLPGSVDLEAFALDSFSETSYAGTGFGLGFAVKMDPIAAHSPGNVATYSWGGAASTAFWVDPVDDLTVAFYTQLLPSSTYPLREQLAQLVYQALVD